MVKFLVVVALVVIPSKITETVIKGKASFYHSKFEGRKCADGSTFRHEKLTAASNKFPLGTILDVWEDGGDTVRLKVTDRMSKTYGEKRTLDLSKKAMRLIAGTEGLRKGVIEVNIKTL